MNKYLVLFTLLVSICGYYSCETDDESKLIDAENTAFVKYIEENQPDSVYDGVYRIYIKTGLGPAAKVGSKVKVIYTGKVLKSKNELNTEKAFDKNTDRENPFEFILGNNDVIAGWEKGIEGLRQGDRVELIIHSKMAYKGVRNGLIEPYSSLWFDIEVVNVE